MKVKVRTMTVALFLLCLAQWSRAGDGARMTWTPSKRRATVSGLPVARYLERDRPVYVQLPPGYHKDTAHYRVIYAFDGESALSLDSASGRKTIAMDAAHDSLLESDVIHPAIIVAIPNAKPSRRYKELSPPTPHVLANGGGEVDSLHAFITHALKPWVDATFRTLTGPEHTGICGTSWGGFAAGWLAYHHPEVYGLAGCTSVGIYADGYVWQSKLVDDKHDCTGTRFWFSTGSKEGFRRAEDLRVAVRGLIRRGWKEERDVAFYVFRNGGHTHADWAGSMPLMLRFLLRKKQPSLTEAAIVPWQGPSGDTLRPAAEGEHCRALTELRYDHGYRTYPVTARVRSDTPRLLRLIRTEPGLSLSVDAGTARLLCRWHSHRGSIAVATFDPRKQYERLAIPHITRALPVEGSVKKWPELRVPVPDGSPYRLGVFAGRGHLFCAVDVDDSVVVADNGRKPWQQDGVELRIDARPEGVCALGRGDEEGRVFVLVAMSPAPPDRPDRCHPDPLPEGIRAACRPRRGGYTYTAAVPDSMLDRFAGTTWNAARINVLINDFDSKDSDRTVHEWRPDWRSERNRIGSGIFVKATGSERKN